MEKSANQEVTIIVGKYSFSQILWKGVRPMDVIIETQEVMSEPEFNSYIVQRVKGKRNSRSLSQEQLAKALDLSNHQIADLENERAHVDIDKLRRLSRYFQVNILDWMPDCPETQKKELDIGGNTEKYKSLSDESKDYIDRLIAYLYFLEVEKPKKETAAITE